MDPTRTGDGAQHLVFVVEGTEYGVEIGAVEEIRPAAVPVTALPGAPRWVRGVINLRGVIVPIYDLRARLGQRPLDDERFAVIVVVRVAGKTIGVLVDAVADVLTIERDAVQEPSSLGHDVASPLLRGIAHAGERVILLMDLGPLVAPQADGGTGLARGALGVQLGNAESER